MSDTYATCSHCPARFTGEDASRQLSDHTASFHPAGAPVERVIATAADARAVGKDFGPAVQGVAQGLSDVQAVLADHEERLKAIEEGRRSSTDLEVLAGQLTPRLGLGVVPSPTPAEPAAEDGPTYKDLQARAKELDIPATGKFEELQTAIADEEQRLADAAAAASSGEGDQGGDAPPAGDPGATAPGEAGTPPETGPAT